MKTPKIVGIVNITEDSFSDGGKYLAADNAIAHANQLIEHGADIIELGAASSHPDANTVSDEEQITRLTPVLDGLHDVAAPISVDAATPAVQRFVMANGASFINDIQGFPDETIYADLANADCQLILMHSVVRGDRAAYVDTDPDTIFDQVCAFFDRQVNALKTGGVDENAIILDPGMGFFLGTDPQVSLTMLRRLADLRQRFELPVMVCVSRKSFLQKITDRTIDNIGAATLAAELFAARAGADYIRTHDVAALKDALAVSTRLQPGA